MTTAPAGWYADPAQAEQLRYWDGAVWTEHVSPAAASAAAPAGRRLPDGAVLAGWWRRFAALFLDGLITGIPVGILVAVGSAVVSGGAENGGWVVESGDGIDLGASLDAYGANLQHTAGWSILGAVLLLTYQVVMLRWRGATLGKQILGIRVRPAETDGPLGWGRIAARVAALTLVSQLSGLLHVTGNGALIVVALFLAGAFAIVDGLWATGDRRTQTLHDKIAGTVVIRTK